MAMAVHPEARDIQINITDSCNCCCWGRKKTKVAPDTPVYVNSVGQAVRFNPAKGPDVPTSRQRAIHNLNSHLERIAQGGPVEPELLRSMVQDKAEINLDRSDSPVLTVQTIQKVNRAIQNIFN